MISRSEGHNYQQIRLLFWILSIGENVVIHPEGGRTMKGSSFVHLKDRRVKRIESKAAKMIARIGANIIPVFVEKEEELAGASTSYISLLIGRQKPMVIYIGESYKPEYSKSYIELNRELEQKILRAGLS